MCSLFGGVRIDLRLHRLPEEIINAGCDVMLDAWVVSIRGVAVPRRALSELKKPEE